MEAGNRGVNSLELAKLARLYSQDVAYFLQDSFEPEERGALSVFFRANPSVAQSQSDREAITHYYSLWRDYTTLEEMLELGRERMAPVQYAVSEPRNVWEAIQVGENVAEEERNRLDLGNAPIKDVARLLEAQGVRVAEVALQDDISGIFMGDQEIGLCILANSRHIQGRRAFTLSHEYGHVLLDRPKGSTISTVTNRRDLAEVRANAFAAAFLMPEQGVRQFIQGIGKGKPGRESLEALAETEPIVGQRRRVASTQRIHLYDVVHLQYHFSTSYEATLYRLKNVGIISEDEREHLALMSSSAAEVAAQLNLKPELDEEDGRRKFLHYYVGMGIEAYRRGEITLSRLAELVAQVGIDREQIEDLLEKMGLYNESNEEMVYSPE
jgi:Zn-dependent peptidase ImmA (M78 family)